MAKKFQAEIWPENLPAVKRLARSQLHSVTTVINIIIRDWRERTKAKVK